MARLADKQVKRLASQEPVYVSLRVRHLEDLATRGTRGSRPTAGEVMRSGVGGGGDVGGSRGMSSMGGGLFSWVCVPMCGR